MGKYSSELLETPSQPQQTQRSWSGEFLSAKPIQQIGPGKMMPDPIEDPRRMGSMSTQLGSGLPVDENARVSYAARSLFPQLPETQAKDRFFYKNERLAYLGDDGKSYYFDPTFRAPTSLENMGQNARVVASGVGPSMSTVGGVAGGIGTMGFAGGVPGAVAGGVAGEGARAALSRIFTGESRTAADRALQIGSAGVLEGLGQVGGNLIGAGVARFGRTPVYNLNAADELRRRAERFGISLTPAEETGSREAIRQQKLLANSQFSDDVFADFYNRRNEQVTGAVNEFTGQLNPLETAPRMTAQRGVEGAQAAVAEAQDKVRREVAPMYDRAYSDPTIPRMMPDEELMSRPSLKSAVPYAQKVAAERGQTLTVPTYENGQRVKDEIVPDWRSWETIKKSLDEIVESEMDQFGRRTEYGRAVVDTRDQLMKQMEKGNAGIAVARKMFEEMVPARTAIEKGVVGDVARLTADDMMLAPKMLFGKGSSPQSIRESRQAFVDAGSRKLEEARQQLRAGGTSEEELLRLKNPGEEQWNSLLSSYIQQAMREIPDSSVGKITNVGGTVRKALFGTGWKRENMTAAFDHDPKLLSDFNSLMDVLDATGRAMSSESATAFFQAGQKQLAQEARGVGPKILDTIEVWKQPSRLAEYWADIQTGTYAKKMADLLTSPNGREKLRQLRTIGPTTKAGVAFLGNILVSGGSTAVASQLEPPKEGFVNKQRNLQ